MQRSLFISNIPSTTLAAFIGQIASTPHFLHPLHKSSSNLGTLCPIIPISFKSGFTQLFGHPPTAILNLWGNFTSAYPSKNLLWTSLAIACVSHNP